MSTHRIYLKHKSSDKEVCLAHQFGGEWEISIEVENKLAGFFSNLGYVPMQDFYIEEE